jgi:hypothetical protein
VIEFYSPHGKILGVIIFFATATPSPMHMATILQCPSSDMENMVISVVLTNDEISSAVIRSSTVMMMGYGTGRKGFPQRRFAD